LVVVNFVTKSIQYKHHKLAFAVINLTRVTQSALPVKTTKMETDVWKAAQVLLMLIQRVSAL